MCKGDTVGLFAYESGSLFEPNLRNFWGGSGKRIWQTFPLFQFCNPSIKLLVQIPAMYWLEVLYPIQFLRDFLDSSQTQDYSPVLSFLFFAAWWKRWHTSFGVEQSHIQIYLLWFTDVYALMYMYVIPTPSTVQPYIYTYIYTYVYIYIYLHVIPYPYFTLTYRL